MKKLFRKYPILFGAVAGVVLYFILVALLDGIFMSKHCPNCGEPLHKLVIHYYCDHCGYGNEAANMELQGKETI